MVQRSKSGNHYWTFDIRNNNTEKAWGKITVMVQQPDGRITESKDIIPSIKPGGVLGGWAAFSFEGVRPTGARMTEQTVGESKVIESPEDKRMRLEQERKAQQRQRLEEEQSARKAQEETQRRQREEQQRAESMRQQEQNARRQNEATRQEQGRQQWEQRNQQNHELAERQRRAQEYERAQQQARAQAQLDQAIDRANTTTNAMDRINSSSNSRSERLRVGQAQYAEQLDNINRIQIDPNDDPQVQQVQEDIKAKMREIADLEEDVNRAQTESEHYQNYSQSGQDMGSGAMAAIGKYLEFSNNKKAERAEAAVENAREELEELQNKLEQTRRDAVRRSEQVRRDEIQNRERELIEQEERERQRLINEEKKRQQRELQLAEDERRRQEEEEHKKAMDLLYSQLFAGKKGTTIPTTGATPSSASTEVGKLASEAELSALYNSLFPKAGGVAKTSGGAPKSTSSKSEPAPKSGNSGSTKPAATAKETLPEP
jgi:hypothetical protein